MNIYDHLKARGLIAQCTNEEKVRELLDKGGVTFYTGFDPTAPSLHCGHLVPIIAMAHMQRAGHRPIALIGGGTTMVGDPSGRTDMRKMLTQEEISENGRHFVGQMGRVLDFSEGKSLMVNNADWLLKLNYVDFLREIGVHFSVNRMLTAECFKSRLEKGLSFIEFNYMLMQSYDFLELYREYNCVMQLGGDDQWSNIIGGVELVRRVMGGEAYGLTFALLLNSEGAKMGKTAKGAVWLDAEKTPPYEFFQYWRNIDDADVIKCMKMLTFLPLEEIAGYEGLEGSGLNNAKEALAYEMTAMIHGRDSAETCLKTARDLFGGGDSADMPSTKLSGKDFTDGAISVADLLVKCGVCPSKSEARRLIEQKGVDIGGQKPASPADRLEKSRFEGGLIIKKGKKIYHRAEL